MTQRLPAELYDRVIDHCHATTTCLKALSRTCRQFLPSCRFHLWESISWSSLTKYQRQHILSGNTHSEGLPSVLQHVRGLKVLWETYAEEHQKTSALLPILTSDHQTPKLTSLRHSFFREDSFKDTFTVGVLLGSTQETLTKLTLYRATFTTFSQMARVVQACSVLETLSLIMVKWKDSVLPSELQKWLLPQSLRELTWTRSDMVPLEWGWISSQPHLPPLKYLKVTLGPTHLQELSSLLWAVGSSLIHVRLSFWGEGKKNQTRYRLFMYSSTGHPLSKINFSICTSLKFLSMRLPRVDSFDCAVSLGSLSQLEEFKLAIRFDARYQPFLSHLAYILTESRFPELKWIRIEDLTDHLLLSQETLSDVTRILNPLVVRGILWLNREKVEKAA